MSTKIYVGNLPYSVNDSSLNSNFAEFGSVTSAKVMMDRDTGPDGHPNSPAYGHLKLPHLN